MCHKQMLTVAVILIMASEYSVKDYCSFVRQKLSVFLFFCVLPRLKVTSILGYCYVLGSSSVRKFNP